MVGVPVRDSFGNLVGVAALVGLAATVALSGTGIQDRMVPVSAVLVGVVVGVLSTQSTGDTAVAAAAAEMLRSLAAFLSVGAWMVLLGGEEAGFLLGYVFFGGVLAVLVTLVSATVAGAVGGVTSVVSAVVVE
jgi:hypothetical protein